MKEEKIKTKICSHCGENKPATKQYFLISSNRQGLTAICRGCKREQTKKYHYNKKDEHICYLNGEDCLYMW